MRSSAVVTIALAWAAAYPSAAFAQAVAAQAAESGRFIPQPASTPPSAGRLEGELTLDRLARKILPSGDGRRVWSLQMRKDQTVRIDLSAENFDTYLEVFARNAVKPLIENDDNGFGTSTNSRLLFTAPEAGTYYVAASRILGEESGPYEIIVRDRTATVGPVCLIEIGGKPQVVQVGTGTGGLDEAKSCFFNGTAGQRIRAETASQVDSTVELKLNGNRLGIDDDSGGNRNARLVLSLPSNGRYELVAAGLFADAEKDDNAKPAPQAARTITLTLTELPAPKPVAETYQFSGGTCAGSFTLDNAVDSGGRPYAYCELTGNAGDTIRVSGEWRATPAVAGRSLSLRLGVDTPLGFASVAVNVLSAAGRYTFLRSGTVMVRISADIGRTGDFRVLYTSPSTTPAASNGR